ncbi:MAG: aromatic ring-hydroxylating dioxygenase subunit alpha [Betaproteobacteria bacterium]|nr:aromatic ring-hydroxylating dioxygenase subunit alpha [Betaproteobacteria bacterium]
MRDRNTGTHPPPAGLDDATVARWKAGVQAERERDRPPAGFPALPPIPGARYRDPAFFDLERQALWREGWIHAAHTDQLPAAGSWLVTRRTGSPVLLIRGADDRIRAFYNTCRHRGAPVARADSGSGAQSFTCGYHGWTYRLDGSLASVTDPRDFTDLDPSCLGLVPVRCERLGSLIFICESPLAPPLDEFLAPAARFLRHLPLDALRLVHHRSIEVGGNHKVVLENFLEAYHFRLLHMKTTHRIFDHQGTSVHLWRHGHSMMLSPHRRDDWVDPGTVGMPEMTGVTEIDRRFNASYNLFPNLILPISATGAPCVVITPLAIDRSRLEVLWYAPLPADGARHPLWEARIANFDRIVDEDVSFVEPIQASLDTAGFRGVPLNYQERRIYHWHEALDRRIGAHRLPPALRVQPVLEPWVTP